MADGARNGRDAGASGGSGDRGGSPRWQPAYYGGPPTHADVPSPKRAPAVETDPGRTKAVRSSATAKAAGGKDGKARPAAAKPTRIAPAAEVAEPAGQRSLGKIGAVVAALLLLLGLTGGLVAAFRTWYTSPAPVAQSPASAVAPEINQDPAIATPGAPAPGAPAPAPAVPAPRQGAAPAKPKVTPANRPDRGHQAPARPEHKVTKDRPESRSERDDEDTDRDDEQSNRDDDDLLDQPLHTQRRASDSGGLLDGLLAGLGL